MQRMMENRMLIDDEWNETEYGVKKPDPVDWDELPDPMFDMEVDDG